MIISSSYMNAVSMQTQYPREQALLERTRKKKEVIFGGQSIKAQIGGAIARPTQDFDILTSTPKGSAFAIEKKFDKIVGFDYFYTKPAQHPGTWKVMGRGVDMRKGTSDDEGIIDYSKYSKPKPKTVKIKGVKYRKLSQEAKAKRKALRDKDYKFRWEKDRNDLFRINLYRKGIL